MSALLTRLRRRRPAPTPVPTPAPVTADAAARHMTLAMVVGRLPHPLPLDLALLVQRIDAGEQWERDAATLIRDAYAVIGRIGAHAQTDAALWQVWGWLQVITGLERQLGLTPETAR